MKKLVITSIIVFFTAFWSIAGTERYPEEYLGLPGDNLNLYAVMKLFQESETLEVFERNLNDENSRINNLDLNGDNLVDYLMVMDYVDGNVHTIVLRAALGKNEAQDVAVFTVQRFSDESVQIQLVGDEALYGKNYIIEPIYAEESETPNPGYIETPVRGKKITVVRTTTYEVASWPLISFIFRPTYVVWRSSWDWGYYPSYYNPWRPFYWHAYHGYHSNWHHHYYSYYRPWHHHRHHHYTNYYYNRVRTYSPTVVVNINNGNYRNTYSRPDTRRVGEQLYARSKNGRSSLDTKSARVRTTGSSSIQRSSVKSGSSATRRSSSVTNGRSATRPDAKVLRSATRKSSTGRVSGRTSSGSSVNRSEGNENKSGTIATGRSDRSSSSRNSSTVTRRSESHVSSRTAPRPSVGRNTDSYRNKSVSPAPKKSSSIPTVRKRSSQRPSATVSGRTSSPTVRQSAPKRQSPKVSAKRSQRSQPAVKSAPSRSSSRSSGARVGSSRLKGKSSATSPASSNTRSSSSKRIGRR